MSRLIASPNSTDSFEPSHHSSFITHHSTSRPLVAEGINKCLCVITSRQSVADLAPRLGFAVKEIHLEHLSMEVGVDLLKHLGVTIGLPQDFRAAVEEYGGHALALTLLGNYIKGVHRGDIRRRDEIPALSKERGQGGHALRVMAAYEKWWGPVAERDILYLLGLFDRPVEPGAMEVLKKEPAIPGVTERLQKISGEDWQWALSNLRGAGLVAGGPAARGPSEGPSDHLVSRLIAAHNSTDSSNHSHHSSFNIQHSKSRPLVAEGIKSKVLDPIETIDCHPLVREYFGEKLRKENPDGWQAAHERLFRYYKELPEKELPDTLAEMEPLFAAVAHGCMAGKHQEALDEVYWKRISRKSEFYSTNKLGAFGSDLACLSHFFEVPWGLPAAGLPDDKKALVLSWAAFRLRALGRLHEARQAQAATLDRYMQIQDPKEIAIAASNLSELLLTMGDVAGAVAAARQCVDYADQSGDAFQRELNRTTLADALHQASEIKEAEHWFREAEELQQKRQPEYTYLYSLQGYRFCDLLLGLGKIDEVRVRAEKTLEWVTPVGDLLSINLDNLSLGRAWLLSALKESEEITRAATSREKRSKQAVREYKKQSENAIGANTRFAPTKDFEMKVGVNLVFTRNSRTACKAMTFLDQAVEGLRKAGAQEFLIRGLLARAGAFRLLKDFDKAKDDLNEALEIAALGGMKLHLCDYHLEAMRLCTDIGEIAEAKDHARAAKTLIDDTGYHRRDGELREIDI